MNEKIVDIVTQKILKALEEGTPPWVAGWTGGGQKNFASGHIYRGINQLILGLEMMWNQYERPLWLTYKRASEMGGMVRKGEHGTPVILWKILKKPDPKDATKTVTIPFLRYYVVFNVWQIDGLELPPLTDNHESLPKGEEIISNYLERELEHNKLTITNGSMSASYYPAMDHIAMPPIEAFNPKEGYYGTVYHELVHSTGHTSRLNRPDVMHPSFGSQPYAKEELIAEVGAATLCHHVGYTMLIQNQAAYCKAWLDHLAQDKSHIITAASAADRAVEYILHGKRQEEGEEDEQADE